MTIRLFDTAAAADYQEELERYDERVKELREAGPSSEPWPDYPKAPGPMVDSRDPNLPINFPGGLGAPVCCDGAPRPPTDALDFDGTSQGTPKGFASEQDKPFSLKR